MINPQGRVSTRSAIPSTRSLGDRPWCPMMDAWRCCWMVSRPCWNKMERQKWCPLWPGSPWVWLTWQFGEPWDGFQVVWLMAFLALMCSSFPSCGHCTARWTQAQKLQFSKVLWKEGLESNSVRMTRRRGRRRPKEDRKEQSKEEREGEEQEGLQGCRQGRNNQFSKPRFQW